MALDAYAELLAKAALGGLKNLPTAFKVKPAVATKADLPMSGNEEGDVRQTLDDGQEYYWDGETWQEYGIDNAVSYNAQTKTTSEKAQARANIGALGDVDFIQLIQAEEHTTKETYVVPVLTDEQIEAAYNGVVAGRNVFIVDDLDFITIQVLDATNIEEDVSITAMFRDKLVLTYQVGQEVVATKIGGDEITKATEISDSPSDDKFPTEKAIYDYIASGNDGNARALSEVDLNTVSNTGFYFCNVCTNRPIQSNGIMIVGKISNAVNYVVQLYLAFTEDKVYVRFKDNNVWKAWVQIYDKSDVDGLINGLSTTIQDVSDDLDTHIEDINNPHETTKAQVGLGNVDNTSDINKPISTAVQNALNNKANTIDLNTHIANANNPHNVTKGQVGLGNVDNTSDTNKPISSATQTALNDKLSLSTQTLTEAQKIQALMNVDGVRIVKLTNEDETLQELLTRIDAINNRGEHVFFDVASLGYPLYLCTIVITYDEDVPHVYRLNDIVSGSLSMGEYDPNKTIGQILDEAVEDFVTLIVTCSTLDGVLVTGQTVTVRQGGTEDSPIYTTKPYNGQPVSFIVPKNFQYFVSVSDNLPQHFAPTTATGIASTETNVILTYSDLSNIRSYAAVQAALTSLDDPTLMIGNVEIDDTWVDTNGTSYSDPAIVVDVKQVEGEDGELHLAAIMQRKWATKDEIQFDAVERMVATGNYLDKETFGGEEVDVYYYIADASKTAGYRMLIKGTDYNVGDPISGTVYKNDLLDNPTAGAYICQYGYNNYKLSAYRQYLTSEAGVGQWWTEQHLGDMPPSQHNSVRGYLAGCSSAMKSAAKPIKIQCYTNSITDGSRIDSMYDKVWLPSGTEMYGNVNANEGTYFPYWKDATGSIAPNNDVNAGRIIYSITNHSTAKYYRLRSACRSDSYYAWGGYTDGRLGGLTADSACAAAPAFAIY